MPTLSFLLSLVALIGADLAGPQTIACLPTASAQELGCASGWLPIFGGENGPNDEVRVLAVLNDGSGTGPALFAGGLFASAGGVPAFRIARWSGSVWSALSGAPARHARPLRWR